MRASFKVTVMAAVMLLAFVELGACQGFSPGNTTGKVLDPNQTIEQLQNLVAMIDSGQDYYPGLVVFQKWKDPLQNLTVLARVLLWTPDCSMQALYGEYTLSGLVINKTLSQILDASPDSHKMIDEGSAWATWIQGNLWLDYFSDPETDSGREPNQTKNFDRTVPSRMHEADSNYSNGSCVPYGGENQVTDSLISDTNEYWNILFPREFVMSTNSKYIVEMQLDCNLVVYTFPERKPLWASNTYLRGTNCTAVMQVDGNLVVYNGDGSPLWASKSSIENYVGTFRFTIQKDGLAVVYNLESGQILWASYRSGL